jgi:outer membrane biosynthesis protein TonB
MAPGMDALDRRERIAKAARIGVPLIVVVVLGVGVWKLASNTAGERREVPQVPVVALTPPPPPPPPPPPKEKPPEPQKTIETPAPTPTPQPKPPSPQPTNNAAPRALSETGPTGDNNFGIQSGDGRGGATVGGDVNGKDGGGLGGFDASAYIRYLNATLKEAIQSDDRVNHLYFAAQADVWIGADGRILKVALTKSSGDAQTDRALLAALHDIGRVDEPPPPELRFPARVALRGRRT